MSFLYLFRTFASRKSKGPFFTPEAALALLRKDLIKPETESFSVTVKLGVDSSKGEQMVKGHVFMPSGTGKHKRIGVFLPDKHKDLALKLGATIAGDVLLKKVKEGKFFIDQVLATEEMIDELKPLARTLGQRGLMPTTRNGTLIPFTSLEDEMAKLVKGMVNYRMTKASIVHAPIGKVRFTDAEVLANLKAFMTNLQEEKPRDFKKTYLKQAFLTSTYGKAYELELQLVDVTHYRCVFQNY